MSMSLIESSEPRVGKIVFNQQQQIGIIKLKKYSFYSVKIRYYSSGER